MPAWTWPRTIESDTGRDLAWHGSGALSGDPFMGRAAKPLIFILCLLPLAWLVWRATSGGLGANPIEAINRYLGDWALRFLLIALAVTPFGGLSGWKGVVRMRRMLGLFAFTYVLLHLNSYVVLDHFFSWRDIWSDIVKRNFITVGMVNVVLLTPLAVTSTNAMVRRLGARRWRLLHRLVYVAGILGVVHFYMMVKADVREPLVYAAILALLLGYRVLAAWRRRRIRAHPAASVNL